MRNFLPLLAAALLLSGGVLQAETLVNVPPEMRFTRATQDVGEGSANVAAEAIAVAGLPEAIAEQVKELLLNCTGGVEQEAALGVVRWTSDWNRRQNLQPNYLVDFTRVKPTAADSEGCVAHPICTSEGCAVLGFTAQKSGNWAQDFELDAQSMRLASETLEDGQTTTLLEAASLKPDCTRAGGVASGNACLRRFMWRSYGLMQVQVK